MKTAGRVIAMVLSASVLTVTPVTAHPVDSFHACSSHKKSGVNCGTNKSFVYGQTVYVSGKVKPIHAGSQANLLRKDPGDDKFHKVWIAQISGTGTMGYVWSTEKKDANQQKPYQFMFKIPGHGKSNIFKVFVLFGE